jgi:hypothetical protein
MSTTTTENQANFPRNIDERATGFDSMRKIVRPSISRAIIPQPRNSMTASPVISMNDNPKS